MEHLLLNVENILLASLILRSNAQFTQNPFESYG
jgi:hypothetical protein